MKGLFNTQNGGNADLTAWEQLALAAEAYVHGELSSAKKHFGAALCEAWATAEPFGETLSERALLKFSSNASSPANIQEFMHQTATFWRRHPEAFRFFSTVVQAPAVRTALLDYHRQRAANFGIGLRASIQEISQAQRVEDQLKHLLQQFVNQSP